MPWGFAAAAGIGAIGSMAAASTQASGQQQAAQTQQAMFGAINQNNQPYMQGGYTALNQLMYGLGNAPAGGSVPSNATPGGGTSLSSYMPTPGGGVRQMLTNGPTAGAAVRPGGSTGGSMGGVTQGQFTSRFTPQDFLNNVDPGYQFQLQTGGQAVRNADTPSQGALSGASLKDLMSFNQGMASTGYQNAYNRWNTTNNTIFGRLSGIAGLGQNAATNVGTAGTSLGTGIAQAQAGAAASQAGGIVGAANSLGSNSIPLSYLMANGGGQAGGFGDSANNTGLTSGNPVAGINVGGD